MSAAHDLLAWQITCAKLPEPVHEYRFARDYGRRFRFDLCWPERRIAVEVQGGIWRAKGAHNTGKAITRDCEKFSLAAGMGWRLLPVTPDQIKSGEALQWIEMALEENDG